MQSAFTERYAAVVPRWPIARRIFRWIVPALVAAIAFTAWIAGLVGAPRADGYLSPVFSPDGQAVFAVARDVLATKVGFGHQFFTPPATVRLHRDRFKLIRLGVTDGRMTVVEELPPSPLEGARISAYHGAIFGVPHAHLRWTKGLLEYEVAVTRHDTPASRTFVIRRTWNPAAPAAESQPSWQEAYTSRSGDEPSQLHADLEVLAIPGDELMPCAIAVVGRNDARARLLVETPVCRKRYPAGLGPDELRPISRRADIERAAHIRTTHAALVERGRQAGLSEMQALLAAGKEMSRLGLYPKTTTLVAAAAECASASPLFRIADAQFDAGLFQDIAEAIASPGEEVDKSMGAYGTHSDYTTSREINEYLDAGNSVFFVEARGRCWRVTITRPG
jgi:hypothetical protein